MQLADGTRVSLFSSGFKSRGLMSCGTRVFTHFSVSPVDRKGCRGSDPCEMDVGFRSSKFNMRLIKEALRHDLNPCVPPGRARARAHTHTLG